jgi:hypothetical protein
MSCWRTASPWRSCQVSRHALRRCSREDRSGESATTTLAKPAVKPAGSRLPTIISLRSNCRSGGRTVMFPKTDRAVRAIALGMLALAGAVDAAPKQPQGRSGARHALRIVYPRLDAAIIGAMRRASPFLFILPAPTTTSSTPAPAQMPGRNALNLSGNSTASAVSGALDRPFCVSFARPPITKAPPTTLAAEEGVLRHTAEKAFPMIRSIIALSFPELSAPPFVLSVPPQKWVPIVPYPLLSTGDFQLYPQNVCCILQLPPFLKTYGPSFHPPLERPHSPLLTEASIPSYICSYHPPKHDFPVEKS